METGDYFFREQDEGKAIYVLVSGTVEVTRCWAGEERSLAQLNPGDCFGEMAIIQIVPRSASVRALEACEAIRTDSSAVAALCCDDIEQFALLQMNIAREISRRLHKADDRLLEAKFGKAGS